jgi:flagellar basal body-associated protein FliL
MAKKAKLDVLDITINENREGEPQDEEVLHTESDEKPIDGVLPKLMKWIRRPLAWILLVSVVVLGSITGVLIHFLHREEVKAPIVQKQKADQQIPAQSMKTMQPAPQITLFEGFVIDQKDDKGNIRMVFCDVALEQENTKVASTLNGERLDVRNVIHMTLRREVASEGPEGRIRLKAELIKEINTLLGDRVVNNVYFTRYEVN